MFVKQATDKLETWLNLMKTLDKANYVKNCIPRVAELRSLCANLNSLTLYANPNRHI